MDLTDEQWAMLEPLLPEPTKRTDGRGRPWREAREVLDGVPWVLRTGAPRRDLLERYPTYQICHRRFQRWVKEGVLSRILKVLAEDLEARGGLDLSECSIDGCFVVAKKGEPRWGRPSAAKARNSLRWRSAPPSSRRAHGEC
jgi:transposase